MTNFTSKLKNLKNKKRTGFSFMEILVALILT